MTVLRLAGVIAGGVGVELDVEAGFVGDIDSPVFDLEVVVKDPLAPRDVAARDGTVRSVDASDGNVEWTTTITTEPVAPMPPRILGNVDGDIDLELVAPSNTGLVTIIDPESGEITASYEREVAINTYVQRVDVSPPGVQNSVPVGSV